MQVASHYLERRGATRLGPGLGIGLGRVHSDDDVGGSSDSDEDPQQWRR